MIYKTINKSDHASFQFYYGNFKKNFSRFISKTHGSISDFFKNLFISTPYMYEDHISSNHNDIFKSRTDLYLTETRRTFL